MKKYCILFPLFCFLIKTAVAQKDTAVYYLKNSGKLVTVKDSADLFLVVLPPDTSIDKSLFVVKAFYPNGKISFLTGSTTHYLPLNFQGSFVGYYPNGHKQVIKNYQDGGQTGSMITFYPNGRFYYKKSLLIPPKGDIRLSYDACNDSLGNTLAENGNGHWITYNGDFTKITEKGKITHGLQDSVWLKNEFNSSFTQTYNEGVLTVDTAQARKIFTSVEVMPAFPGGLTEFGKFLAKNVRYPALAREHNTQGRVILRFVCEQDGSLDDIKVVRGIGDGCDEEAIRVLKFCPRWIPAMQHGNPVRVAYSVPISFTLSNDGKTGRIN